MSVFTAFEDGRVLIRMRPDGVISCNVVAPSIFTPRNLIASWPGFALSLGALVTAGSAPIRGVAVVLLLAGFGIGALKLVEDANRRPDIEGAARFIESTGEPGAPVVEAPQSSPGPQMAMEAALAPAGAPAPPNRSVFDLGNLARFLRALPRRFHEVDSKPSRDRTSVDSNSGPTSNLSGQARPRP